MIFTAKCVEMFLTEILKNAGKVTEERKAKTMSISHLLVKMIFFRRFYFFINTYI